MERESGGRRIRGGREGVGVKNLMVGRLEMGWVRLVLQSNSMFWSEEINVDCGTGKVYLLRVPGAGAGALPRVLLCLFG